MKLYSETEVVARVDGMTVARLRSYVAAECLRPVEAEGRVGYADADVARLRLAADLARDFDLDAEASAMVLSLVDQIHGLRHALRTLGEAVGQEPDEIRARVRARLRG
jgi:chaperone modulatory protein CbpM